MAPPQGGPVSVSAAGRQSVGRPHEPLWLIEYWIREFHHHADPQAPQGQQRILSDASAGEEVYSKTRVLTPILRICIPFDFSTECRGVTAKCLGNLLLRFPFSQRVPDVQLFFVAYVLVVFHGGSSSGVHGLSRPIFVPNWGTLRNCTYCMNPRHTPITTQVL